MDNNKQVFYDMVKKKFFTFKVYFYYLGYLNKINEFNSLTIIITLIYF